MPPDCHQVTAWWTGSRRCSASWERPIHWTAHTTAITHDAPTARIPTSDPFFGRCLPTARITKNETAGTNGMTQTASSTPLPLQRVDLGEVDRVQVAVDDQDDRQADTDLGGGDGDDEQGEDLPGDVVVEGAERDEVDVDGGEDELDRHQHEHAVLAG